MLFLFILFFFSFSGTNGFSRGETVSWVGKEFKIDGAIHFRAEDSFKYNLFYGFENDQYNITIDSFPTRRIPPGALKSLIG